MKEETDVKENVTPAKEQESSTTSAAAASSISQDENNFYKLMFGNDIASVRFRRLHCTACDAHIGSAPAQVHNMYQHPVLRVLLCAECRKFYGDGTFEQGDDHTDMFCRWCANGGNLYCCSYCSNTFCYKCIRRNFTSLVRKKIEADEKWRCFVCNPSDLYSARAICWALLEHIKTVTRILKNDKKISAEDFDIKMNLDESPCCPRRRKRKRRRIESNSEDEDETYTVESNGLHSAQRKMKKMSKINLNGKIKSIVAQKQSIPIPIRPRPSSFLTGPSQSITKSEDLTIDSENVILPSSSVINSNPSRYDSNVQQPSLYHTTFMNSAGSNTYIRAVSPATMNSTARNRIIVPVQASLPPSIQSSTSYQQSQPSPVQSSTSYQPSQSLQSPQNAMVSIPNPTDKRGRSLFLLPKRRVDLTLTPNIIDLDSDSDDEPKVVEEQNNSVTNGCDEMDVDICSNKVVPVALTWENSDDDGIREEQPLREMCTTLAKNVTCFSEMMLPHNQELRKMLSDVKKKMICFFDLNVTQEDIEVAAQQKVKQFCLNMREVVLQLANINDRIVREYYTWRRSRKETETETPSSIEENIASQENVEIPLDMICINESDSESEYEGSVRIKQPSDLVKSGNIVENLLFPKKTVVHRGTGDDNVHLYVDKMTQVCNISKDYEKCISYSIVTKSDNDSKAEFTSILEQTLTDKNFGNKYEEQFIDFLQHIEDHGIQVEDPKNLTDLNKEPFQELIETNLPFNSHLFQNIDSPDIISDESKICEQEKSEESDSSDDITDTMNDIADTLESVIDNDNQEIVNDSDSDTRMQEINDIRIQGTVVLDEKLQQTHDTTDGETTSIISNDEDTKSSMTVNDSNVVNMEVSAPKGNEEDCTIINE